jgi:hypothetical protein
MSDTLSDKIVEAGVAALYDDHAERMCHPGRYAYQSERGKKLARSTWEPRVRACLTAALAAANYAILPAEMTAEQAARSLAGSGLADRVRVSAPDIYALLVEARRATWREMVAVMGEGSDDR